MKEKKQDTRKKLGIYMIAAGFCLASNTGCQSNPPSATTIGEEKALTSALAHAQLNQDDISDLSIGLDYEQGSMVYDIDFNCNGYEYDYDVDAVTGEVVTHKQEPDGNLTSPQNAVAENSSSSSNPISSAVPNTNGIGEEAAKAAAFSHAGVSESNISNYKCKLDHDGYGGTLHYEVDFDCDGYEYEYEIDTADGSVLKFQKEIDNNPAHHHSVSTASGSSIGEAQAKAAALSHAGALESNISNYKCKLDHDGYGGTLHYEVDFDCDGYEYEYEIDAADGSVLKFQKEIDNNPAHHHSVSTASSSSIGEAQAKAAALSHAGALESNISNYKCKLDDDGGILHYEVDFNCDGYEYEYEIDAADGSVLKFQKETGDHIPSMQTNTGTSYIGESKAKAIALSHAGAAENNLYQYQCELEHDDGHTYYEIEFETGNYKYEYEIDAYNGTILKDEKERDN